MSCSAQVFTINLRLHFHYAVNHYRDATWIHTRWSEVSRPHNELSVGVFFTNCGDWYLEIDSNSTVRGTQSVVAIGPIKLTSGLFVILEDPLVEVVWALINPTVLSTINRIPPNTVRHLFWICSFGLLTCNLKHLVEVEVISYVLK